MFYGPLEILIAALQVAVGGVPINFTAKRQPQNIPPPVYEIDPTLAVYQSSLGPGASQNPQVLYTRQLALDIRCWGQTVDQAEILVGIMLTALFVTLESNFTILGESWTQDAIEGEGYQITLTIQTMFAVTRATLPVTVIPPLVVVPVDATFPTTVITDVEIEDEEIVSP